MKSAIWICYDLGIRANYEGLYAWLDLHDAKECCDNVAFLNWEHTDETPVRSIRQEMNKILDPHDQTRVRIYVIYRERNSKKMKGVFVLGTRKSAPWYGHAARPSPPDEEEGEEEGDE